MSKLPKGYTQRDGKIYNERNKWVEYFDGRWREVRDGSRLGWWRYHEHAVTVTATIQGEDIDHE